MASAATAWQFTGDYFENCNCDVVCPCLFSTKAQLTSQPTQGVCDVAIAVHIERGELDAAAVVPGRGKVAELLAAIGTDGVLRRRDLALTLPSEATATWAVPCT